MNSPGKPPLSSSIDDDNPLDLARKLFPLASLQSLDVDSALRCQTALEHGGTFGIWETPEKLVPHMRKHIRRIDLRQRIASFLLKDTQDDSFLNELLDEGVLWCTRLALLLRMGPGGQAGTARNKSLDASTIARVLYQQLPPLVALGLTRRLERTDRSSTGFVFALTADDLRAVWANVHFRTELMRLTKLHSFGFWSDAPAARDFKGKTTPVRGEVVLVPPEQTRNPHPPIPDDYLAAMGPRVLWLIKDLGPNLIQMLETLLKTLEGGYGRRLKSGAFDIYALNRCISHYFETSVWQDRNGRVIEKPPFKIMHGSDRGKSYRHGISEHSHHEWPPRNWSSVQALVVTLQSSHLWMTLMVMAARIGEVATLGRNCVDFAKDGRPYANGRTYKTSRALGGNEREWPIPDILLDALAQQVRLIEICERLETWLQGSVEKKNLLSAGGHLWSSLGASSNTDASKTLVTYDRSLQTLAIRIGLTPKPGGKNLHPHRFRKSLARLAGLAIDGSQKVLMLLLGHEDVTTTLGYMQTDPAFAKEVDDITRELRIMRGQALIEDMRTALRDPSRLPYGGYGGGGAPTLAKTVRAYEEELHRTGQEWGANTARELSVLLTNNGESARLISAHVICTKTAGEVGLCSQKKGAIVAGKCQTECKNRIEDKTGRRDTERVIPILVQHAQENIANNDWLPFERDKKQLEQELKRYDDIGLKWRANPDVRVILAATL